MENGIQKPVMVDGDFMSRDQVYQCIKQLKVKNSEGYDHIPQRILLNGVDALINPLATLFSMIYDIPLVSTFSQQCFRGKLCTTQRSNLQTFEG